MRARTARRAALMLGRVAGSALLGITAAIHVYLYVHGYRAIPHIGAMFLADGIAAAVLAAAVLAGAGLVLPFGRRLVAATGAALEVGTLGGLVIATNHGLLGFVESSRAELYWRSVLVESTGALVLALLAAVPRTSWADRGPAQPGRASHPTQADRTGSERQTAPS